MARRLHIRQTVVKFTEALPKTWRLFGGVPVDKQWIDVFDHIERGINEGLINITNINGDLYQTYYPAPWIEVSALTNATVTASKSSGLMEITCDKKMQWINIRGLSEDCNANNLVVTISGAGLTGNVSQATRNKPIVQVLDTSNADFNLPSIGNPYRYNIDGTPAIDLVGIGTINNPSVSLKFALIGQSFDLFDISLMKL
jgi:hypothetical protein